ncbi:MAG: hypothetical protein LBG76_02410 [Treponema sp.]|nr:hypothetical protein [Treponema sp.]
MNSIHGGLCAGEIGFIASPSGLGKTSVLVQIALDKLLLGEKVIHVSFTQHSSYVLVWYEDIFNEFIKKKNLENEAEVKDVIVKNRVLMNFNQEVISADQMIKSLKALITEGGFNAGYLIIDGYNFSAGDVEAKRIAAIKDFAKEMGVSVWYSCAIQSNAGVYDKRNIPLVIAGYESLIDVVIVLEPKPDHIELTVSKDRDIYKPAHMALRLDPKTLLILEE